MLNEVKETIVLEAYLISLEQVKQGTITLRLTFYFRCSTRGPGQLRKYGWSISCIYSGVGCEFNCSYIGMSVCCIQRC